MIVRSARPTGNFTVLHNKTIRDARLSYKARGILIDLLSLPDNWRTSAEDLARRGPDGLHAIRAGLKELETFGYLRRTRHRDDLGRIRTTTTVYDRPVKLAPPESGFPTSENPPSIEGLKERKN
jgi:hypothetical protein